MPQLMVADLTAVVYTIEKVFDRHAAGRLDTAAFLLSGGLAGVRPSSSDEPRSPLRFDRERRSNTVANHRRSGACCPSDPGDHLGD